MPEWMDLEGTLNTILVQAPCHGQQYFSQDAKFTFVHKIFPRESDYF